MESGWSTATSCWRKSWAGTISAPAVPANASRSAVSRKAAFDGVNRDHYFQGLTVSKRNRRPAWFDATGWACWVDFVLGSTVMTTLLMSSRHTADDQALWRTAIGRGWSVARARGIRLPDIEDDEVGRRRSERGMGIGNLWMRLSQRAGRDSICHHSTQPEGAITMGASHGDFTK